MWRVDAEERENIKQCKCRCLMALNSPQETRASVKLELPKRSKHFGSPLLLRSCISSFRFTRLKRKAAFGALCVCVCARDVRVARERFTYVDIVHRPVKLEGRALAVHLCNDVDDSVALGLLLDSGPEDVG